MEPNLDRMCRACTCESETMTPMYSHTDSSPDWAAMLATISGVRVSPDDGLPCQLCERCSSSLGAAMTFRQLCEKSDALFRQYAAERTAEATLVKHELPHDASYDASDTEVVDHRGYDDEFFMFKVEPETQLLEKKPRVGEDEDEEEEEEEAASVGEPSERGSKPYPCELCRKAYTNGKSLKRHMAVHRGDGLRCNGCERVFARRDHLRKHLQRMHAVVDVEAVVNAISLKTPLKYDCEYCGVDAPNKASMAKHLRACHRDKLPKRKNCAFDAFEIGTSGDDEDDVDDDDADVTGDEDSKTVGTASGGGAFATIKEERVSAVDGETRLVLQVVYKCNVCGIEYDNQHSYAAHMTKHSGPLPKGQTQFSCHLCQKMFAKRKNLKQHLLTHNEEKANKCTLCHRAFTRPDQLILHMNNHTGKKRHQCPHCEKGFNMLSTLKDHLRTHSGEKPYLCSICGKGFSQNTNLKQHLMRHSAIKPFGCHTCHAKFVSKGELDAHLRKHTGEHPFVCDTCGTGFTTSSSLVKHRRIHSGERPYACDLCPLRFTALGTLKNHRRTHTGEKPFECTHCGRAFTQKSDMVSHVRTHTGERPYVCNTCGSPYQQSSALKAHIKSHHPDLKKPIEILITPLTSGSV